MSATAEPRAKRREGLIAILLLAFALLLAVLFWPRPQPATYEGKTVDEWLLQLDPNVAREKEHDRARIALERMGTNALPDLERILSQRPNKRREWWKGWLVRFHLSKPDTLLPHEWNYRAARAAYMIAESGNVDIRRLLPHLSYHFTNSNYGEFSRALTRAGDEGISVLTNYVLSDHQRYRDDAASALSHVNRKPQAFAALIRVATLESNRSLRANALLYLRGSKAPADQVVPLTLQFLRSDDAYTRRMAAGLLADYRSLAEVSNALHRALSDPDENVRRAASYPGSR
jgi:hypothetical protein